MSIVMEFAKCKPATFHLSLLAYMFHDISAYSLGCWKQGSNQVRDFQVGQQEATNIGLGDEVLHGCEL